MKRVCVLKMIHIQIKCFYYTFEKGIKFEKVPGCTGNQQNYVSEEKEKPSDVRINTFLFSFHK